MKEEKRKSPEEVEIRLLSNCNMDCKFCHIPQLKPKNLKTNEIVNKILSIDHTNPIDFTITGGEPTLFKKLDKIIKLIKKLNSKHSINLQTNGLLFSKEPLTKKLAYSGLNSILLSFHSHKKNAYHKITNTTNTYGKIIKAIENINKYNINVEHSIVICKDNYNHIDKTIKFLYNKIENLENIQIANIFERINYKYKKDYHIKLNKTKSPLKKTFNFTQDKKINITTCGIPLCYVDGNYSTYMLGQYNKDRYFKKNKECKKCKLDKYCRGEIGDYANLYGTDDLIPIKNINKNELHKLKRKITNSNYNKKIYFNNTTEEKSKK